MHAKIGMIWIVKLTKEVRYSHLVLLQLRDILGYMLGYDMTTSAIR